MGGLLIAVLGLAMAPVPADADAAAARLAYERGDYARAMAEWQEGADKNDPAAEFGLGNLYEFGGGDLAQDYGRAAYWYKKAAKAGDVEAEYRLGLIYGAGGDNFAPDLAEAEKWADLAVRHHGVWGSLAADFQTLLDRAASADERAQGEKRAAAWEKARLAAAAATATATATGGPLQPVPPSSLSSPAGKAGGCPGWPFPTLPCTEQFPALTGAAVPSPAAAPRLPAKAAAEPPLAALQAALAEIDCAALSGRNAGDGGAVVTGTVPQAQDKARVERLAARYFPTSRNEIALEIVPPPICRTLVVLDRLRPAGETGGGLELELDNGGDRLREGDPILLQVRAPNYPVVLRIDYFSLDGRVLHLEPGGAAPPPRLAAKAVGHFGGPAQGENWRAGGAPFGTEMIAVVATPEALDLGERPRVEEASSYLTALEKAFARARFAAGEPGIVATLPVKTSAR